MYVCCKFYQVEIEMVKNEICLFGKIEVDNNKIVQVFLVVGGLVILINVGFGDYVEQGIVLVII